MKTSASLLIFVFLIAISSCTKEPDTTTSASKKSAYAPTQKNDSIPLGK